MAFTAALAAVLAMCKQLVVGGNVADGGVETVAVTAGVQWTSTGNRNRIYAGDSTPWLLRGSAADYEINVDAGTGDALEVTSSAVDTWLSLGTTRIWSIHQGAMGSKAWSSSYEIRLASTGSVVASGTISLSAERSL